MGCNCGGNRTRVSNGVAPTYMYYPPEQRTTDPDTGEVVVVVPAPTGPYQTIYEARGQQRLFGGGRIKTVKP